MAELGSSTFFSNVPTFCETLTFIIQALILEENEWYREDLVSFRIKYSVSSLKSAAVASPKVELTYKESMAGIKYLSLNTNINVRHTILDSLLLRPPISDNSVVNKR